MDSIDFRQQEDAISFLENYAYSKKEEIDQKKLSKDLGLIKTYGVETSENSKIISINNVFKRIFKIKQLGEGNFYSLYYKKNLAGFLEFQTNRYIFIHTFLSTKISDKLIRNIIHSSSELDGFWLSTDFYNCIWKDIIVPDWPDRFVKIKFEFENIFETSEENSYLGNEYDEENDEAIDNQDTTDDYERGASITSITDRVKKMNRFLPQIQASHPAFKTYKMLRLPATNRGGYEIWSWGKFTHRANSFQEGRTNFIYLTDIYSRSTSYIENALWFNLEKTNIRDGEGFTLTGAPLIIRFNQPLSEHTFENLMNVTFAQNRGPLRLWGNPIRVGDYKYHIYGIDLHLWQKIYLEISKEKIIAILPKGTCGNSVHRLITNIKSYIDPEAEAEIASMNYSTLLEKAFIENGN